MPRLRESAALHGLLLLALTLLAHGRGLGNDFVDLDDPGYVTENHTVRQGLTLEGLAWAATTDTEANWHPLTWLSHMADVELYGLDPTGHHLTNLLLHAANALLLYGLLRRWTGSAGAALAAAGLFALHPLHVESVAWVAERKDVLAGLFWMLSLTAYTAWARRGGALRYACSLAAFALGLLAKPMVVTLPCVLLLLDFWPLRRPGGALRRAVEKVPFFLLTALSCAVTFLVQRGGGAVSAGGAFGPGARVANAVVSYARYLGKLLWPTDLAPFYPHRAALGERMWSPPQVALAALLLALVTLAAILQRRRRPWLPVGWLWFLGVLVPAIGLVQVGLASMADRYAYLPAIGIYLVLVLGARDLLARLPGPGARAASPVLAAAVLLACTGLTWRQTGRWRDGRTLSEHALAVTRDNWMAHQILGMADLRAGRPSEAMAHFEATLAVFPDTAVAHNNLGTLKSDLGRKAEALEHFRQALRILPSFAAAHGNLGALLGEIGRAREAAEHFERAVELDPNDAETRNNYAAFLGNAGRLDEAIEQLEQVLRLDPGHAGAHLNLGVACANAGDAAKAREYFEAAARLDPEGDVGRTARALLAPAQ